MSQRYPWLGFVLPLAVFMLFGSLEPTPGGDANWLGFSIEYGQYPLIYTIKIALTTLAIGVAWPTLRAFPLRISWLAVAVGLLGGAAWIGLCKLKLEVEIAEALGNPEWLGNWLQLGERTAFDPFSKLASQPAWILYGFLAVRFFGLVAVIAVAEELFLRGLLMRYVMAAEWWKVPFGQTTALAIAVGTIVPVMMHPAETIAAAVWFSGVTWLMVRTRSLWDCIVAHAITNLALGVYVVSSGTWTLW